MNKKTRHIKTLIVVLVLFAVILTAQRTLLAEQPGDLLFIVNKTDSAKNISIDDLRNIYLGNKGYWDNKSRIIPFNRVMKKNAGTALLKKILKMSPSRYRLYWRKRELAGKGLEPTQIKNSNMLASKISDITGSIGYVLRSELSKEELSKVHVIFELSMD